MVTLSFWHPKLTAGFLPNWSILALMPYGAILNMNLWMSSVTIFRHDCYKVWYLYHIGIHPLWLEPVSERIFSSFIIHIHPQSSVPPAPLITPVPSTQEFSIHNPPFPDPFPPALEWGGKRRRVCRTWWWWWRQWFCCTATTTYRPTVCTTPCSRPALLAAAIHDHLPLKINLMIHCKFPSQTRWDKKY